MKQQIPTYLSVYVDDDAHCQYYIKRGFDYTPSGTCVEYDDYYEIAMHSWYMRVCKKTLEVTGNLRDVSIYEKIPGNWAILHSASGVIRKGKKH
jgi:hypothetical protein